jgi:microcystin-dependent protein
MTVLQPLGADEVAEFGAALDDAFLRAVERQPLHRLVCDIAGVRIGLELAGRTLTNAVRPAFAGILVSDDAPADITLRVFDATESGVAVPAFRRPMQALIGFRGQCAADPGVGALVFFDHGTSAPYFVDTATSLGLVAIDDLSRLPYWTLAAPFRSALGVLLQSRGIQLVHGAAVGGPDGAVILTGYGGSGKSTTALSCHKRGLTVLGDDYVAIKPPTTPGAPGTVHRVYSSLKVHPHEVHASSAPGTSSEKVVLFPETPTDEAETRAAPCLGFWSVGLGQAAHTWCEPRHPEDVARIAASSTGLQIPGDDHEAARIIRACAEAATTTQQLWLGSDRSGVVDVIEAYLRHPAISSAKSRAPVWRQPGALQPISVIIPVYNGSAFIADALRDIVSQGYHALDIIVVDDGSTDDLDTVLARIDIPHRLIRQENRGPAAARNRGIQEATGAWIAFQDVDDLWVPGALQRLAQDLVLHASAPVVHGKIATLYPREPDGKWRVLSAAAETFPYFIHAGLYRRDVFDRIGGFDETLRYGEDMEWFVRLRTQESSVMIPDVIVHRRRHDHNMTNDAIALAAGSREAWKKILLQRMQVRRIR